jgi:putative NIF3 family GTP cyclohydrolase 1 type 2
MGLCLVDATHYATEAIIAGRLSELLNERAQAEGVAVKFAASKKDGQVFVHVPTPELEDQEL